MSEASRLRNARYYARHCAEINERERAKAKARRIGPEGDAVRASKRAHYAANAERLAAYSREHRNREYQRAYNDTYYVANADRLKAARRQRTASLTDEQRERQRATERASRQAFRSAHRELHRERSAETARKRRATSGPGVSARGWRRLVSRYDHRCAYCGVRPSKLEQDHVIPVSRGGRHAIGNILPACRSCNAVKGQRLLVEWRLRRALIAAA